MGAACATWSAEAWAAAVGAAGRHAARRRASHALPAPGGNTPGMACVAGCVVVEAVTHQVNFVIHTWLSTSRQCLPLIATRHVIRGLSQVKSMSTCRMRRETDVDIHSQAHTKFSCSTWLWLTLEACIAAASWWLLCATRWSAMRLSWSQSAGRTSPLMMIHRQILNTGLSWSQDIIVCL